MSRGILSAHRTAEEKRSRKTKGQLRGALVAVDYEDAERIAKHNRSFGFSARIYTRDIRADGVTITTHVVIVRESAAATKLTNAIEGGTNA